MFALLALICFVLALFGVRPGEVDLVILGFAFIATHLLLGDWRPWNRPARP
jgi:hypothetical protein